MKKRALLTVCLVLLAAAGAWTLPADVVYAEGRARVRYDRGGVEDVYIGDSYDTGDTVTTGRDGFVELDQAGLTLKISPDTVFSLQEKEERGAATGVFSLVLGSIKFRYQKVTGQEPLVQTGSCLAGVRGTELSVYAGADGSALILVDSGLVEVEAAGRSVTLAAQEGVEVRPGAGPGDKFKVQRDQIDYRTWNEEKLEGMLADPEQAVVRVLDRMEYYARNVQEYYGLYEGLKTQLDAEREKGAEIYKKEGQDAAQKYDREVIRPIADKTRVSFLNFRYYAITALSLRRYVAGRMYLLLKARTMAEPAQPVYANFRARFEGLLELFERSIVPHLVEADI
jgi:hypothetical protein